MLNANNALRKSRVEGAIIESHFGPRPKGNRKQRRAAMAIARRKLSTRGREDLVNDLMQDNCVGKRHLFVLHPSYMFLPGWVIIVFYAAIGCALLIALLDDPSSRG